jgi:hypothetical protein
MPLAPFLSPTRPWRWAGWVGLAAVVAIGAALRLAWVEDIEYKSDEAWTFYNAEALGRGESLAWVGMPSSAGPANPALSLWVFVPLSWLADEPTGLARGVQWLSIASIVLLIAFAVRCVPRPEREAWLWAAALLAVNPVAVLHHRKIWPPCVLPVFIALFLIAWWYRDRRPAAFLWGLLGTLIGQIHVGAFFFTAGFALWSWRHAERRPAWRTWLAGSLLGSLTMLPWLVHLATAPSEPHLTTLKWARIFEFKFWIRWLTEPLGIGLDHSLGDDNLDFLRQPLMGGQATWLVGGLHLAGLVIGAIVLVRAVRSARAAGTGGWKLLSAGTPTELVCGAALWGYGLLLTLSCLPMHRHYMVIVYPIELLWFAWLALRTDSGGQASPRLARSLLATLVAVELLITASFLVYVHQKQDIHGDYGMAWGAQRTLLK